MTQTSHPTSLGGTVNFARYSVARVGYGAMQLRNSSGDREAAIALVKRAIALGVNHIDTAEFYGDGFVNHVLRDALRGEPDVVVATKLGADPNPGQGSPIRLAQRPEELRASVERNLKSLGLEQIPLVNLRRADIGPHIAKGDQLVDIED
ncbi:aryl-alcohol dehydrogenase-like predicted oxidoreductase [Neorhizobium galegae]|nr:aryl-alcohol dehydrogenase-like predicted oxidoreductase [Neorhizobium galegae]